MNYKVMVNFGHLSESEYDSYPTREQALSEINRLVAEQFYDREQLSIVIGE
jgi:hypothetical protein